MSHSKPKILYLVTEDWTFCYHRLPIARAAKKVGFEVVVATRVQQCGEDITREGLRLIPIRMRRRTNGLLGELSAIIQLIRIYRSERPDLVHQVAMKPVLYGSLVAYFCRIPVVINALAGLGYIFTSHQRKATLLRFFIQIAFRLLFRRRNTRVILQNPDDQKMLSRIASLPLEHLTLILGSGVDISRFTFSPEPEGEPIVAMVSRMLWDKGVGELVEAARILKSNGAQLRVVLVGSPDPDNPSSISEKQLQDWHEKGTIEWWGEQNDIPAIWAKVNIAVLPSSYGEGIPKVLLEAAACGRPIITTDTPGCREVIRHEETGLLIPKKNSVALAQAISKLANDPALRNRMGLAGCKRMENLFSEDIVVRQTLELYAASLGNRWPN